MNEFVRVLNVLGTGRLEGRRGEEPGLEGSHYGRRN